MHLEQRLSLLEMLRQYITGNEESWMICKEKALYENGWFIPEFIDLSIDNIASEYLQFDKLNKWVKEFSIPAENKNPRNIGIVMAGNIPMVGFHDFLTAFVTGHKQTIKLSSKDNVLLRHLVDKMISWNADAKDVISFSEMLKGCDAYIATGSNNSSRYFEYYFGKYPHIIRKNRTSVGILDGTETSDQLQLMADDVYQYFGLGCRNVTKIYVPREYDFIQLLKAFDKYSHLADHFKYKNNYDYQLAVLLINKIYYMTNGSILLQEKSSFFSPISMLHYQYYDSPDEILPAITNNPEIQCITGDRFIPFGQAQRPSLNDFADNVNTVNFLMEL